MNQRLRIVRGTLFALSLAILLARCGGSDEGSPAVNFGINGLGNCGTMVVDVDMGAAGAKLSHADESCLLDPSLEQRGCVAVFSSTQQEDVLHVTISGCTIPATSRLFQCGFRTGDIDELTDVSVASCTCATQGCDSTPPVCADTVGGPTSCETCNNGLDDDGNDRIDCEDANCENSPYCEGFVSSSTSSTSSTAPTSSTSTTLTGDPVWAVVIRLPVDVTLGGLQWNMNYAATGGSLVGKGGAVDCRSLVAGALVAANDHDDTHVLAVGMISVAGIDGPVDVMECRLQAATEPAKGDFVFSDIEASTPDSEPIENTTGFLKIQSIIPENPTTTTETGPTTTTTMGEATTTTMAAVTTTTLPDLTTTTSTTTTSIPAEGVTYSIRYSLTSSSAALVGALQWKTDYSGAPGVFHGDGSAVACTSPITGLFAPNNSGATKKLTLGLVSFTGFAAPTTLADCLFDGSPGDPPVADDFQILIEDQTDVDGAPITATIVITQITTVP